MRILGIDQSTKISGYSIFEDRQLLTYGRVKMKDSDMTIKRMSNMKNWILGIVDEYDIDYVVLEDAFLSTFKGKPVGVSVYATLNKNIGIIENAFHEREIPYKVVLPKVWKAALKIKGRGRAEQKANTKLKVLEIFGIATTEDESDAIGIGAWACINEPWEDKE